LLQILLGLVSFVCVHALIIVAHTLGWYPEAQLAKLLIVAPDLFRIEQVRWSLIAVLSVLVWAAADYFFYRRHLLRSSHQDKPTTATPDKSKAGIDVLARHNAPEIRVSITIGTGHPFETVAVAGLNLNRTVRAKIQNESKRAITNGMLQLVGLDPPNRGHRDFLLRSGITLDAEAYEFFDVASYSEGSSQGHPGSWIALVVPPTGAYWGPLPNLIPLGTYAFHLKFSSLEGGGIAEAFCRLSVDENHILRLQEWGNSAKLAEPAADHEISLMEAATNAYEHLKDKPISIVIEGLADSPDEILTWLCNALTRYENGKQPLVKLHGSKPPSRKKEEVYLAPLRGYDFIVQGNEILLQERNGRMRYESLSVSSSELESAIQELANREV
jgi:hypothetical protein